MACDPLLARIELAIDLYAISQTAFGYHACNDPALVAKMRAGRIIKKPALRQKIEALLSRIEEKGEL
jgi:hypothetical protein